MLSACFLDVSINVFFYSFCVLTGRLTVRQTGDSQFNVSLACSKITFHVRPGNNVQLINAFFLDVSICFYSFFIHRISQTEDSQSSRSMSGLASMGRNLGLWCFAFRCRPIGSIIIDQCLFSYVFFSSGQPDGRCTIELSNVRVSTRRKVYCISFLIMLYAFEIYVCLFRDLPLFFICDFCSIATG